MEQLEGSVERITFRSEETFYSVVRLRCRDHQGLVTAVGTFPQLTVGETLRMQGEWSVHPEYGRQFKVASYVAMVPATLDGLAKYLGSGLVKGVGPVTAQRIVEHFGHQALDILENQPERLVEVPGIGPAKAASIGQAFAEQKEIRDVMIFLQGYGVSPGYAARIYRHYGSEAPQVIRDNPYRLADEVFGIGFKTADKLAQSLGLMPESAPRLIAGLKYVLGQLADAGHTSYPLTEFYQEAAAVLEVDADLLPAACAILQAETEVFLLDIDGQTVIYLAPFFYAEQGVANRLAELCCQPRQLELDLGLESEIAALEQEQRLRLAPEQRQALVTALQNGVTVITGGPGTGKTTIVRSLLQLMANRNRKVLLAAPTGRAAKRMSETTGSEAKTIHRLLEYAFVEGQGMAFARNEDNPLEADVVILDEASMIDILLMYHFLKALPPDCQLVLVGDIDQLPSVGPGNVLRDIIDSEAVPTVRLKTIFRQAGKSLIVVNAHRVNSGEFPYLNVKGKDFFFIQEEEPMKILDTVLKLCQQRLPNAYGYHPYEDIQVLTPMRRTPIGVDNLNIELQRVLNPPAAQKPEVKQGWQLFRLGDKVMQTRNNYKKQVFNGDIGRVQAIDLEENEVGVVFPEGRYERLVTYDFSELDELTLAYAISVHKSQGSEYPVVVLPISVQHYIMLQRNLLYTAITRAKKLVVLVGTKKAIALAVKNNKVEERHTLLQWRLQKALAGAQRR
ncbi:MAG: ATP-dependent RecD-like DNA helicase [Firmicutes bacterium]|nr:ATP-dependent RecD-like DNA helicase [Bacillota bacterium]